MYEIYKDDGICHEQKGLECAVTYTLVNKTNMINQFHKYNSEKRSPHFLIVANQGIVHRILEEKKAWHRVSRKHISHLEKSIFSNFF